MVGNINKRFGSSQSVSDLMSGLNIGSSDGEDRKAALQAKAQAHEPDRTLSSVSVVVPVFKSKRTTAGIRLHPEVKDAITKNAELSELASRLLTEYAVKQGWL